MYQCPDCQVQISHEQMHERQMQTGSFNPPCACGSAKWRSLGMAPSEVYDITQRAASGMIRDFGSLKTT